MEEIFDIIDTQGNPTGETVTREKAHAEGIPHRTAHIWIIREKYGRTEVLLQKRSMNKDSFPGKFDTSSAGHIQAGDEPLESDFASRRGTWNTSHTGAACIRRNIPDFVCKRISWQNVSR